MISKSVSVVIATLGGACLKKTIESLNNGSLPPKEIIVCIPKNSKFKTSSLQYNNTRFLFTKNKGQVLQRLEGFKQAQYHYVIQLDDDVLLEKNCIFELVKSMNRLGDKCVMGPALISKKTKFSVHKKKINLATRIFYWLINGRKGYLPGTITKAGTCIGVDSDREDKDITKTEWLSGGMIIHFQKNLILEDYFPFKGKAYSEDLIHSFLMQKKKLELYICNKSLCFIDDEEHLSKKNFHEFKNWIKNDFKARKYFINLYSQRNIYLYIYYIKEILSYFIMKIIKF